jgi:hypothetical protein
MTRGICASAGLLVALLGGLAILVTSSAALADETTVSRRATDAHEKDQPHTSVEGNTGFLLLPAALVCPQSVGSPTCTHGEYDFAASLQNFYRFGPFGVGAGIQWAASLRSDAANGDASIGRSHSRSYFLAEALGRYYFLRSRSWDFWAGVSAGLVVLNDSWTTNADNMPYEQTSKIGPEANTLGTEGFTLGLGAGAEWSFLKNWSFGPMLRYSSWFLPTRPQMTPTLDVASLGGQVSVIDVAVHITYRISL